MRRILSAFMALWTGLAGANAAHADHLYGRWISSAADTWPLIAIHAVLTPDGRVLNYGTKADGTQTGYFIYDIWTPSTDVAAGHRTLNNLTLTDLFCSSQVVLPDSGSVFIAAGDNWTGTSTTNTGNNNTNIFRPSDDSLSRGNNMARARWYSSSTVLTNGEVYVQGRLW